MYVYGVCVFHFVRIYPSSLVLLALPSSLLSPAPRTSLASRISLFSPMRTTKAMRFLLSLLLLFSSAQAASNASSCSSVVAYAPSSTPRQRTSADCATSSRFLLSSTPLPGWTFFAALRKALSCSARSGGGTVKAAGGASAGKVPSGPGSVVVRSRTKVSSISSSSRRPRCFLSHSRVN